MSEVEKTPATATVQVDPKEREVKPAEENSAKPTAEKTECAAEPEVKQTTETETQKPEENGDAKAEGKDDKSNGRHRDEIDEKIDRYARETKRPFQKRPKQIRSNFENLPETDDADEIRRQVEFYFSDANLHQDGFLLKETGGSQNRPFPLKQLHTFKRMRRFQPFSAVLAAVKDSKILEVNDKDEITRKTPISGDYNHEDIRENKRIYEEKSMARTVYAKGFGEETETTQTDIEEFFAPYGDVSAVRLRRWSHQGEFKGSVLVEFSDEETAKSFLDLDPKPRWQGKRELEFRTKKEWSEQKKQWEADHPRQHTDRYEGKGKRFERRDTHRDDRSGRNDRHGDKRKGDRRGDGNGDRSRSRSPRRKDNDEDWRDRRDRERGDRKDRNRGGRRDHHKGKRSGDRRSKRDRADDEDREDREDEQAKRERSPDSGDEVSKLATKKRSRDDTEGGVEPEAKKVKEDESEVKTERAAEEVSAAA